MFIAKIPKKMALPELTFGEHCVNLIIHLTPREALLFLKLRKLTQCS
jgi:hypothetical protein